MKKILTAIDFSDVTSSLLKSTLDLAKAFDSEVLIVHVEQENKKEVEESPEDIDLNLYDQKEYHNKSMRFIKQDFLKHNINIHSILLKGLACEKIMKEVSLYHPSLIIIGSHHNSHELKDFLHKAGEHIIHHAPCPVLVIPTHPRDSVSIHKHPLVAMANIVDFQQNEVDPTKETYNQL